MNRSTPATSSLGIRVPIAELMDVGKWIVEAAGPAAAAEILFRLGRRLGHLTATRFGAPGAEPRAMLKRGFAHLSRLGLGDAHLDSIELAPDRGGCRLVGTVLATSPLWRSVRTGTGDAAEVCDITVGYLTGFAAAATGIDVVCTPLPCDGICAGPGCAFEIHPGHRELGARDHAAPGGRARFFLRSMGQSLSSADVALDDLLEDSPDAVILIDSKDIIRFWNRGAEHMFLHPREDAVGQRIGFLVPGDLIEADELGSLARRLERDETVLNHITRRVRKDGAELWVSLNRAVLRDSSGGVIGSTATIRDITHQRQTELELSRSRGLAMVGELAAKVAHEIKNPLAGIYAAVQILGRGLGADDQRKEILDSMGGEIRRLDETVQDLLRFAKPAEPRPRTIDLRTFVGEIRESLRHNPDMARHDVSVEIPERLIVAIDSRLLGQVFSNLLLNASQAMEQPGSITVAARVIDEEIVIDVSDTGPGISAANLESIFEPFVTTKARGTGLGLPIAQHNVQAHGGRLWARNLESGGARFTIAMPWQPAAATH